MTHPPRYALIVLAGLSLAPTAFAQVPGPAADAPPPSSARDSPDYSVLSNPLLDYSAIRRAQNFGLTDRQIGEAAALADQGQMPLSEVLNRVEGGSAFSALAAQYGLSSQDADRSAPAYADLVERYLEAYRLTGTNFTGTNSPDAFPPVPTTTRDAPSPIPGFGPQEPPRPGGRRGRGRHGGRGHHPQPH